MSALHCGNCNAALVGPYCAQCGQHAHESARALDVLLHDAWHLFTHVDGRFWSTLKTLLLRPGRLTIDYFAERRARYMPPFRLYFVLSLIFFALAAIANSFDAKHAPQAANQLSDADAAELRNELKQASGAAPAVFDHLQVNDSGVRMEFGVADCDTLQPPRWLQTPIRQSCKRLLIDHGQSVLHAFSGYIPKMMFLFLPLIALVTVPLYGGSGRFYVEHLVFFLHTHAALFLAMTLFLLLDLLGLALPWLSWLSALGGTLVSCYAIWYIYRSMRRFYGQGRALTFVKFALVSVAYALFLGLFMAGTFALSLLIA